jgi:hypothetical protein
MKAVEYMRSEDAALYLGFTKEDGTANLSAFKRWMQRAKPKSYRIGKRSLRFRRVDLDRCIEAS